MQYRFLDSDFRIPSRNSLPKLHLCFVGLKHTGWLKISVTGQKLLVRNFVLGKISIILQGQTANENCLERVPEAAASVS